MKLQVVFIVTFLGILGISDGLRPPPFFPLEPPRFFENLRRDFEMPPPRRPFSGPRFNGEMRYTKSPIEIRADFHFQPIIPGLLPPPFSLPSIRNFRRFPPKLFTPSSGGERAETPGQVTNFENDLKEMEKETENSLNDITTNNFSSEETTEFPAPSSYVNVGITGDDNKDYKYNYSI